MSDQSQPIPTPGCAFVHSTVFRHESDPAWRERYQAIATAMRDAGVAFSSPGGSLPRWLCRLLNGHFGCPYADPDEPVLKVTAVRAALQPFIEEIERRVAAEATTKEG
jgi:hypothetical protein